MALEMVKSDRRHVLKTILIPVLQLFSDLAYTKAVALTREKDIAIGGVDGFETLADPTASVRIRRTGRVRLYVHDYIWQKLTSEQRKSVVKVFGDTGPAWVELGLSSHIRTYWESHFDTYREAGLKVSQACINLVSGKDAFTLAQWKEFVNVGKNMGLTVVAPIFAPNMREWEISTFRDDRWNNIKQMALYGGGLTIDSPPWYFLSHPDGYRQFVEDEVVWCRENNIQSSWIISPPRVSEGNFSAMSRALIDELRLHQTLPHHLIVENYMSSPPEKFPFIVGYEDSPQTVSGVALWIAENVML